MRFRSLASARLLVLAAAAWASVATSAPVEPAPEPEVCGNPVGGISLDLLELGGEAEAEFEPLADGDAVTVVYGGQGSPMIGLRLRIAGEAMPACLPQSTEIRDAQGFVIASEQRPLETHDAGDGTRTTATTWLPMDYAPFDQPITVTVGAGNKTVSLELMLQ